MDPAMLNPANLKDKNFKYIIILYILVTVCLFDLLNYSYFGRNLVSLGGYGLSTFSMIIFVLWFFYLFFKSKAKVTLFFAVSTMLCLFEIFTTFANIAYSLSKFPFRALEMLGWLSVCYIAYYYARRCKNIKKVLYAVIPFAAVLYVYFWIIYLDKSINVYGLYNAVFYPLFFFPFFLVIENPRLKWVSILAFLAIVLVSYKRSALLFLGLAIGYYILQSISSSKGVFKKIFVIISMIIVIIAGAFLYNYLSVEYNLDWSYRIMDALETGGSNRLTIWSDIFTALKNQRIVDWLVGHGYRTTDLYGGAHNDYLEILYDYGLIGFGLFAVICGLLVNYRIKMKKAGYKYLAPYTVSLIFFFIYGIFGQLFIMPQWFFELCLFWGIIMADFERQGKKENS